MAIGSRIGYFDDASTVARLPWYRVAIAAHDDAVCFRGQVSLL